MILYLNYIQNRQSLEVEKKNYNNNNNNNQLTLFPSIIFQFSTQVTDPFVGYESN